MAKKKFIWYKVNAGYNKREHLNTLFYYGLARTKAEVKKLFFSWLTVYSAEPATQEEIDALFEHPEQYIFFSPFDVKYNEETQKYDLILPPIKEELL